MSTKHIRAALARKGLRASIEYKIVPDRIWAVWLDFESMDRLRNQGFPVADTAKSGKLKDIMGWVDGMPGGPSLIADCSVDGCERPVHCKGMCSLHYQRVVKGGVSAVNKGIIVRDPTERFWEQVDKSDGCWTWKNFVTTAGYPRFYPGNGWKGGTVLAHRWIFEQINGAIPVDMHVDHQCRNRACVRPDHLRLLTPAANGLYAQQSCRWTARSIEDIKTLLAEPVKSVMVDRDTLTAILAILAQLEAKEAEPSKLICERCGVDRGKDFCPSEHWQDCGFIATAHAAPRVPAQTGNKETALQAIADQAQELPKPLMTYEAFMDEAERTGLTLDTLMPGVAARLTEMEAQGVIRKHEDGGHEYVALPGGPAQ